MQVSLVVEVRSNVNGNNAGKPWVPVRSTGNIENDAGKPWDRDLYASGGNKVGEPWLQR